MKGITLRIISALLLLFFIFTIFGCRQGKDKGNTVEVGTTETTEKEEPDENEIDLSLINQLREDYNLGTCKNLSGEVSVYLFYMDDFESEWTESEAERFTRHEVEPALRFLESEAKKYGVELNFTVRRSYLGIYYDDEVITSVKDTGLASVDVLWQAAIQNNYVSTQNMIKNFRLRHKTEEVICLTIFNKSGTAYAINPKKDADMKVDEHCIIFVRDSGLTENSPKGYQASYIAHSILHLYGAENFYDDPNRKFLAEVCCPDDIMLYSSYYIIKNTIGESTAFYIGWINTVPDILV